jgi:hypothetical protein
MNASRCSPLSRVSFVQVRSEIVGWSRRYCAFSSSGFDFPLGRLRRLLRLRRRSLCLRLGLLDRLAGHGIRLDGGDDGRDLAALCVPDPDIVAAEPFLAGFPDPREIPPVRTANPQRVIEAIAEAVRQDGVVHGRLAALFLGDWEVLEGGHPVAPPVAPFAGDRLEVARASKLLGAEAFGHLACELRDVTLLSCLDEGSLHAERPQLGRSRSAAFRIPLDPRHVPTLCALSPAALGRAIWLQPAPVCRDDARRSEAGSGPTDEFSVVCRSPLRVCR